MVKPLHSLLKARRAQSRILEAVIAAAIIFAVFSVSLYLMQSSDVKVMQEKADLDRLGYNVLHTLVESGAIEETLLNPSSGVAYLKSVIQKSLPSAIYFNLTIFSCHGSATSYGFMEIELTPLPLDINNTSAEFFTKSIEVSSASASYTSKQGDIYHLVLMLARPGGEGQ